jgi:hypothetical protein
MGCRRSLLMKFSAAVLAASAGLFAANSANAQMAVFQTEHYAQMHCPDDKVVWLDFGKRRYYTSGQKLYARGRTASFVCMKEAKRSGYKKSRFGRR